MPHCLENILLTTSVAVEKDAISKAELVRVLVRLATASHEYVPEGHNEEALQDMNAEWHRRFGHLMFGKP
jgi:hypothetical protein